MELETAGMKSPFTQEEIDLMINSLQYSLIRFNSSEWSQEKKDLARGVIDKLRGDK